MYTGASDCTTEDESYTFISIMDKSSDISSHVYYLTRRHIYWVSQICGHLHRHLQKSIYIFTNIDR